MALNGCNFCGKVGSQLISNERTTFNYSCLEVKNKNLSKANKADKQRSSKKEKSQFQEEFQVKNELHTRGGSWVGELRISCTKHAFEIYIYKRLCPRKKIRNRKKKEQQNL
jgi:hypothetical protein